MLMEPALMQDRDRSPPGSNDPSAFPWSPFSHRMMFLALSTISFLLFAPTVVLPLVREHGELLAEEARLRQRVAELQDKVRHRAELAEAFQHDAVVNERLAVLDLGYRRPNEEVVTLLPEEPASREQPAAAPAEMGGPLLLSPDWPDWAHRAASWADSRGLIEPFLDADLRPVLLLMSAGGLIAAFVLFAPRSISPVPRPEAALYSVGAPRIAE